MSYNHEEYQRSYQKEYSRKRREDPEYLLQVKKLKAEWYQRNKEKVRESRKKNMLKYVSTPHGLSKRLENNAHRRAANKSASLLRSDEWNVFVCSELYELAQIRTKETNVQWHVDHVIPIRGENVCGFHVWYNLKVIPASENISKSNKLLSLDSEE